ncbi:ead/Ea22-like family protein [Salmonella enterica]|nr:ead/Ea22-like family protein [Salmonella enterica]EDR1020666.1 ead/Ea22-like family protein [Salmonella enterica subsp. enterica serovar Uganda]EGN0030415.1 ead/Ea22-like family protein [Salmonella enterica subsp. enterica serovar Orion]EAN3769477.1 ead/Ea22-like family protein [Salmonella enterica]EAP4575388.1 ead/Ea22-like family protein [Salmonella enterica]
MTALNKYAALRQLAEEATQGEWWSDVVETDGEYGDGEDRASGYHSYAVYVGSESLLDMTNSTAACIHTEWDHDYHMAWDETAKRNAEFIAAANPATVLALLDELEKEKGYASTYEAEKWHYHGLAESEGERADRAEKALEAAEQELQALKQHVAERAEWEQKQVIKRTAGIGVKGE